MAARRARAFTLISTGVCIALAAFPQLSHLPALDVVVARPLQLKGNCISGLLGMLTVDAQRRIVPGLPCCATCSTCAGGKG
jgi:hypothetical protein